MPSARFEPTIPASEMPQTYALDRAATEIGDLVNYSGYIYFAFQNVAICPKTFSNRVYGRY